ncbi:MAG: hypothetical protein VXX03_01445 [Candidatus Thermoplasmatota archaeon]|nr:hypothetical protein [Candidatus Thermoplasmatota archaeon]
MTKTACAICTVTCEEPQRHCRLCAGILMAHGEHRWLDLVPEPFVADARKILGGRPTSRARWGALKDEARVLNAGRWALLEDERDDPIAEWHAGQAAFEAAAAAVRTKEGASRADLRALARGVTLSSGHLMQFSDEGMLIDGRGPFPNAPWKDLLELMVSSRRRGWDLLALALAASAVSGPVLRVPRRPLGFGGHHEVSDRHPARPLMRWLGILRRLDEPLDPVTNMWVGDLEQTPPFHWQGRGARGPQREALDEMIRNRPHQIAVGRNEPWVTAWNTAEEVVHRPLPQALSSSEGRLSLRVARFRRGGEVVTVKVPRDPRLWAWLLGWVLQPPWAEERARLHALIVAWNGGSSNDVDPALARSIVLFHNVMRQAGERVHIEGERVLIRGRFGHGYEVQIGRGAHGAPFVVRGVDGKGRTTDPPLCITEDRTGPTRPVGDVLATVVLSLLDDVATADTIEPLHRFMHRISPAFESDTAQVGDLGLGEALPGYRSEVALQHRSFEPFWYAGGALREGNVLSQEKYIEAWIAAMAEHGHRPRRPRHRHLHRFWQQVRDPPYQAQGEDGELQRMLRERMGQMGEGRNFEGAFREFLHLQGMEPNPMEGFAALRGRVHIHDGDGRPHQRPDIREAPLRFSDLYARVWTVLGRSALGREVRLRRATPYDVELPTGMRFTVRDHREHQFLRRLLRLSGWERGDGPLHFVRRRPWHRGAPARLARELNRMQEHMDGQANVPWWWNYPREEFIDEDILNDWRLREDLTD